MPSEHLALHRKLSNLDDAFYSLAAVEPLQNTDPWFPYVGGTLHGPQYITFLIMGPLKKGQLGFPNFNLRP